jgi:phosphatidate cytidylyltransferase
VIAGAARVAVRDAGKGAAVANLAARVKAWWVMAALLATAFLAGDKAVIVLFAFVSFACLREFLTVTSARRGDRAALLAAFYLVLPAQYWFISAGYYWLCVLFIPLYSFLILSVLAAAVSEAGDFLARIAEVQSATIICVYCISYVPALLTLQGMKDASGTNRPGLLAVFLIVVVQSSDIMQYVFGKLLGRHQILPGISPSKTVAGLCGGLAFATALGGALWWITPFTQGQAAAIALLLAVLGFLGGLVMSAIKRDRGIKDWGHLIPGHGGMLDRVDSLCFAAPVFFYLTRWLVNP